MAAMPNRRKNLRWLWAVNGSQTSLANRLKHRTLTQPILSSILRSKRPMHDYEARDLEKTLGIPTGWMDEDDWVKDGWKLIKQYQSFDLPTRAFTNDLIAFLRAKRA